MWLLVANGIVYSGRARHGPPAARLLPVSPGQVVHDLRAALAGRLGHADLVVYNAVQKALYLGVPWPHRHRRLGAWHLEAGAGCGGSLQLLGGYESARLVHFLAMAAIVGFLVIHVVLALLVPRSLRAMILGR